MQHLDLNIGLSRWELTPPDSYWNFDDEDLPTQAEIIAKYRAEAILWMDEELDDEDRESVTEEDIELWALDLALENGEQWIDPNGEIQGQAPDRRDDGDDEEPEFYWEI